MSYNDNDDDPGRGLLARWLNYCKTVSSQTCSIQRLMAILRRAVQPRLHPEEEAASPAQGRYLGIVATWFCTRPDGPILANDWFFHLLMTSL